MLSSLFETTTIPVLEQVVSFAQSRHTVLAGNIANLDTPGYQAKDLSVEDFQKQLRAAISERQSAGAVGVQPSGYEDTLKRTLQPIYEDTLKRELQPRLAEVAKNAQSILRHDLGDVGMEQQVSEMVKNQLQHNLALSIMTSQFRLLQTAVSGRT
jgi:flagellar basal-body rod protein FlgB